MRSKSSIIPDHKGHEIGQYSWAEWTDIGSFVKKLDCDRRYSLLIEEIESILTRTPVVELEHIQINQDEVGKGYGKTAMDEFLRNSKQLGFEFAIAQIGKINHNDDLETNVKFYHRCGWTPFSKPFEFSLRLGYVDLARYQPSSSEIPHPPGSGSTPPLAE